MSQDRSRLGRGGRLQGEHRPRGPSHHGCRAAPVAKTGSYRTAVPDSGENAGTYSLRRV